MRRDCLKNSRLDFYDKRLLASSPRAFHGLYLWVQLSLLWVTTSVVTGDASKALRTPSTRKTVWQVLMEYDIYIQTHIIIKIIYIHKSTQPVHWKTMENHRAPTLKKTPPRLYVRLPHKSTKNHHIPKHSTYGMSTYIYHQFLPTSR